MPPLLNEPLRGESLEAQLHEVAAQFVNNAERNRIEFEALTIHTSEIFSWFGGDFVPRYAGKDMYGFLDEPEASVLKFMFEHADKDRRTMLSGQPEWKFVFVPCDWSLNDKSGK